MIMFINGRAIILRLMADGVATPYRFWRIINKKGHYITLKAIYDYVKGTYNPSVERTEWIKEAYSSICYAEGIDPFNYDSSLIDRKQMKFEFKERQVLYGPMEMLRAANS